MSQRYNGLGKAGRFGVNGTNGMDGKKHNNSPYLGRSGKCLGTMDLMVWVRGRIVILHITGLCLRRSWKGLGKNLGNDYVEWDTNGTDRRKHSYYLHEWKESV